MNKYLINYLDGSSEIVSEEQLMTNPPLTARMIIGVDEEKCNATEHSDNNAEEIERLKRIIAQRETERDELYSSNFNRGLKINELEDKIRKLNDLAVRGNSIIEYNSMLENENARLRNELSNAKKENAGLKDSIQTLTKWIMG